MKKKIEIHLTSSEYIVCSHRFLLFFSSPDTIRISSIVRSSGLFFLYIFLMVAIRCSGIPYRVIPITKRKKFNLKYIVRAKLATTIILCTIWIVIITQNIFSFPNSVNDLNTWVFFTYKSGLNNVCSRPILNGLNLNIFFSLHVPPSLSHVQLFHNFRKSRARSKRFILNDYYIVLATSRFAFT